MPTIAAGMDELIERFEDSWREQGAGIAVVAFAPDRLHPQYREIVTELIRVDLELIPDAQRGPRLVEHRQTFPEVFADPQCRALIAFEDYRLRLQAGEAVTAEEYAAGWSIDVRAWPAVSTSQRDPAVVTSSPHDDPELRRWRPQLPGERFAGFELLEELGQGAFSRVFLARQSELADRQVVVKITAANGAEPRRLAQLQHSHIVPVYSVHQEGRRQALCMPFLGRTTLADFTRGANTRVRPPTSGRELVSTLRSRDKATAETQRDPESPDTVVRAAPAAVGASPATERFAAEFAERSFVQATLWLAWKIAEGLAHAHERGIVHRDLKPANILLADDCQPLILDFNIAAETTRSSSAAAHVGGTLPYMSPEQLAAFDAVDTAVAPSAVDARSDIYSFGVLLFELLAGRLPFPVQSAVAANDSSTRIQRMLADRRSGPAAIQQLNPDVSPAVAAIISRCLAWDLRDRYQTTQELVEDLDCQLRHLPLRHAPDRSLRERAVKWSLRHPRLASVGTAAVLVGLIATSASVLWVRRERQFERQAAINGLRELERTIPLVRAGAQVPGLDDASRQAAAELGRSALARYQLPELPAWRERPAFQRLDASQQEQLEQACGELLFWLAEDLAARAATATEPERQTLRQAAREANQRASACYEPQSLPVAVRRQAENLRAPGEDSHGDGSPALVSTETNSQHPLDAVDSILRQLRAGDFVAAEAKCQARVREHPEDFAGWFWLGHAQWGQGRLDQAEIAFSVCTALAPATYISFFQRGLVRTERHEYSLAQEDFTTVWQLRPGFLPALINRGIARQHGGDHRGAVEDFSEAIRRQSPETRLYFLRARSWRQLGDAAGAQRDLSEGLQRTPQDELSWLARGLARISQPQLALRDFQAALALNPDSIPARQNLSALFSDYLHQPAEAIPLLDELLHRQPSRPLWHSSRAVLRARLGNREGALTDIARGLVEVEKRAGEADAALVHYQAACVYALLAPSTIQGEEATSLALKSLRHSLPREWSLAVTAETDPDLKSLRELPAFQQLLQAAASFRLPPPVPATETTR